MRVRNCLKKFVYRISLPEVFRNKDVLKNFLKFTEKHLCWSVFLIKLKAQASPPPFLRKTPAQVCSMNFARFFRTPIYDICERLLLVLVRIGLAWGAANLSVFRIIDCKSLFEVLRCSFQLILC